MLKQVGTCITMFSFSCIRLINQEHIVTPQLSRDRQESYEHLPYKLSMTYKSYKTIDERIANVSCKYTIESQTAQRYTT